LGWEFAWVRLLGALLVAFGAAVTVALLLRRVPVHSDRSEDLKTQVPDGPWHVRVVSAFDELFHHVGAWMILGIVAAALLEVGLPVDAFREVNGTWAQFAAITLVAVPSYVCAPSATPLAAVLLAKGLSPGAVLVGLLLGPATNVATMVFLRRWFGGPAAVWGVVSVVALAWAFGFAIDTYVPLNLPVESMEAHAHTHGYGGVYQWLSIFAGLLLLRALFKTGVRGFLSTLAGDHGHTHGHSHGAPGHGHGH
jgi:uncharacterized membrane protein YraQ (UPF0718 family)